jgi:hypothetical protein
VGGAALGAGAPASQPAKVTHETSPAPKKSIPADRMGGRFISNSVSSYHNETTENQGQKNDRTKDDSVKKNFQTWAPSATA